AALEPRIKRAAPVYPFLSELRSGADPDTDVSETLPESKSPLGRGLPGMAVAAWQVTMHPERFGGRGHQLGMLFLAALPGLFFARRLRGLGTLLSVAAAYGVLWFLLRQNVRFLFPIIPPASVAVVWVWIEIRRFPVPARRVATAIQAAVVVVFALVGLGRSHDRLAVAVGWEDRQSYLSRREPSFAAATVANLILEPVDHILIQDNRPRRPGGRLGSCVVTNVSRPRAR
ncbi:MAG: hypothetical protein NTW96_26865, partial [Planctomycetia bacterium]|nr:hypothetical protein [Planctomycetia bacterium]